MQYTDIIIFMSGMGKERQRLDASLTGGKFLKMAKVRRAAIKSSALLFNSLNQIH